MSRQSELGVARDEDGVAARPSAPGEGDGAESDDGRSLVIDAGALRKSFGDAVVLRDLTLRVGAGEIFGLIGPSGSGKTTAIHLLCGHLRPDAGVVSVLGEEPTRFTERTRQRIGYMPQGFILYPELSVRENAAFTAGLYGLSGRRARDAVRAVLELVGLWDARRQTARSISGGMRRRLALAAALVHGPDLLFADEPTANLDPILRARLWDHFRAMKGEEKTLLVTTQYIDEAEQCDRVGLMYDGGLIAEGRPEELRRKAFGGDVVDISLERQEPGHLRAVSAIAGVRDAQAPPDEAIRVTVDDAAQSIPVLIEEMERSGARVRSVAQYRPTFDEVFIRLIEQHGEVPPSRGALLSSAPREAGR